MYKELPITLQRVRRQFLHLTLTMLLAIGSASADDLEIYSTAASTPKVLFLLDTSNSMALTDGGPTTRIERLRTALTALLENVDAIDVGLMEFSGDHIRLLHAVGDVADNRQSLITATQGLSAGGGQGGTPTVAGMYEAQKYLTGSFPYRGDNGGQNYQSPINNQCESSHVIVLTDGRSTADPDVVNDLIPVVGQCSPQTPGDEALVTYTPNTLGSGQLPSGHQNLLFWIYNGNWTRNITLPQSPSDRDSVTIRSNAQWAANLDTSNTNHDSDNLVIRNRTQYTFTYNADRSKWQHGDRGTCGIELARYQATRDQFGSIPGTNTITTHSIGFNIRDNWLEQLATAGNGIYRNAESSQELLVAFQNILNIVQQTATTAAPTVPVNAFNQSRHSDELYYSFFQPGTAPRWEGNIKKYRLTDGQIVDYYDQPVIEDGNVVQSSVSLWSVDGAGTPVADGARVSDGGMAARQPAGRKWFTDAGVATNANGGATPKRITRNNQIAAGHFGAANNAERNRLSRWVRGYDSIDRDGDSDTAEPNRYVADGIHSSPVLISYRKKEATDELLEVLYTTTNMGVVHALDPKTGDEIWSYSPAELLPNIKAYVDNTSESHVYGLDGSITSDITYKTNTTYDFETDKVSLYLTQRRGGNRIFALDVSNPLHNTRPVTRRWTITGGVARTDFRDLAQTWSTPQLVPITTGCPGNCTTKNALLFSGGYNPDYDNKNLQFPVSPKSTGHGNAVYLVDPDNGKLLWSAGKGQHHDLNLDMNDSVPATPVPVDTNADGAVDILFFSDIAGHIWRIDIDQRANKASDLAVSGGKIASLNRTNQELRFFNPLDVSITGLTNGIATFHLVAGSGMRSSPAHREPVNNRLFVIKDSWVYGPPTAIDPNTGKRVPEYRYVRGANNSRSVITPSNLRRHNQSTSNIYGYYRVLEAGEKVLAPTLTHANQIFLTTYMPADPAKATSPCDYQIGESRLYIMHNDTGENKLNPVYNNSGNPNNPHVVIGPGIMPGGFIVDTGSTGGPDIVVGVSTEKLYDLVDDQNIYRRFYRTGWSELDDF